MTELFSWVPLPYCSPSGCLFPIKYLALSAHMFPWAIHFRVLDKGPICGPGSVPPSRKSDWFNFLAVQGTLKSLLQPDNSKASVLWCSVFFMVQLSHFYMTIGKTIALTIWTFVSKVISLLLNTLSRIAIAFLPRCISFSFVAAVPAHSDF